MAYSLLVSCEQCGYENFPQHRFCGMCGAALRLPEPVGARTATAEKSAVATQDPPRNSSPRPVSGPSFLGLANDEPTGRNGTTYLLEDDEPTHYGRYLLLIMFLCAVAAAGWRWREPLGGLANRWIGQPSVATSSLSAPAAAQQPAPGPETAPVSSTTTSPEVTPPPNGTASTTPAAPATPPAQAASAPPPSSSAPASSEAANTGTPAAGSTAGSVQPAPSQATEQTASPQATESAANSEEQPAVPKAQTKHAFTPKQAKATTPTSAGTDNLEAEGEKYLYGAGVAQNCNRAQRSLMAAAEHSNAKAQSVLGTMYATGHCVSRDPALAYRWFAKALHQDPSNTRIEEDLRVLWNQMTPDQRQLAMHSN